MKQLNDEMALKAILAEQKMSCIRYETDEQHAGAVGHLLYKKNLIATDPMSIAIAFSTILRVIKEGVKHKPYNYDQLSDADSADEIPQVNAADRFLPAQAQSIVDRYFATAISARTADRNDSTYSIATRIFQIARSNGCLLYFSKWSQYQINSFITALADCVLIRQGKASTGDPEFDRLWSGKPSPISQEMIDDAGPKSGSVDKSFSDAVKKASWPAIEMTRDEVMRVLLLAQCTLDRNARELGKLASAENSPHAEDKRCYAKLREFAMKHLREES